MSNFGMQVKGEEVGFAALENLANLSDGHNSATFDTFSKSAMRTAGQIRWCARDPEVFVVVTDHVGSVTNGNRGTESLEVRIMRTQVESLIDPKMDSPKLPSDQSALQRQTVKKMREWFKSQAGVAPLVKILSRRTRYKRSMPDCETWAYLDRDIRMMPNSGHAGWLTSEDEECDNTAEFPHAVLEIQWDGNTPGFIDELSQSYMVCYYNP